MSKEPCKHEKFRDNHCADMTCWNYVNKCPKHMTAGSHHESYTCSLEAKEL
jgi:hypothetical protein